jgi:hypothetical protein
MLTIAGTGPGQGIEIWRNSNSIADNSDLGLITFLGGTSPLQLARIVGRAVGTNEDAGALTFETCPAGGGVTERMRITSDGYTRLSASAGGIQFNGDTAAANALDDYEEGTVDITTLTDGSATLTQFVDNRTLSYTKIGNRVYVNGNIYNQSISGTWSNPLRIPLPFTASSGDGRNRSYGAAALYNWGSTSDNIYLIEAGGTYASLVSAGSGESWGTITTSEGFTAVVNFFYITS